MERIQYVTDNQKDNLTEMLVDSLPRGIMRIPNSTSLFKLIEECIFNSMGNLPNIF